MDIIILRFIVGERGEAVNWLVTIILGIVIALIVFYGLKDHIKNAVESMGKALSGQ